MAAADLRAELTCSICWEIYTDPVTLPCGHNYCLICIERTWDWQKSIEEDPSCPECRRTYRRKPEIQRNLRLQNIAEQFLTTDPEQIGAGIPENMKCSSHDEYIKYYCWEESVCVCVSCCLAGEHRGHRVELLSEASEKKKETLRKVVEKLRPEREETERGAQRLQKRRREVEEKAAGETERVTALFRDIREQLEALEKRLLSDISSQKEDISLQLSDLIEQLEIKKDELSRKIRHIEELCNMADPLTVLQERESHGAADNEEADNEARERGYSFFSFFTAFLQGKKSTQIDTDRIQRRNAVVDLDVDQISKTLLKGLVGIVTGVKGRIYGQEATDLSLDINTVENLVTVLGDRKSASYLHEPWDHPQYPDRYQVPKALSNLIVYSGYHYWEVGGSESGKWGIGVAYPSIENRGDQSSIGNKNKSWGLYRWNNTYSVRHDNNYTYLPHIPSCRRIRILLDYEAGCLSFYELSEPIRHLHTFTANFTEPLSTAYWVWGGNAWQRIDN